MIELLNARAICLLRKRQHRQAGEAFYQALWYLEHNNNCFMTTTTTTMPFQNPRRSDQIRIGRSSSNSNNATTNTSDKCSVPFGVYDCAFLLGSFMEQTPPPYRRVLAHVILAYNLGLAHHLCDRDADLYTAYNYYRLAYNIVTNDKQIAALLCEALPSTLRVDTSRLLMALYNNLAHVCGHFCQEVEMHRYLRLLDAFLNINCCSSKSSSDGNDIVSNEEYLFFYYNSSVTLTYSRPAPAA